MRIDKSSFTIFPSVVLSGQNTLVSIIPNGSHARFDDNFKSIPIEERWTPRLPDGFIKINDDISYTIFIIPMEHSHYSAPLTSYDKIISRPCNGCLTFHYTFSEEQEYALVIIDPYEKDHEWTTLSVYCIDSDLCSKYPFKGDLHVHSYFSDGHEAPEIVAANYRAKGFDFMALTDHCRRFPSEYLVNFYRHVPTDLEIYYGEEIHVPYPINIHAICINGTSSVNEYYVDYQSKCDAECASLIETLNLPSNFNALDIAKHIWIANEIKKRKGLSILVHPHWVYQHVYHMRDSTTKYLIKNNIYDAFEVLGGLPVHLNNLQAALYTQLRAEGAIIPIVGGSDSHGTEPPVYFNEIYTIAFAEDTTFANIASAIKTNLSVAIQNPSIGNNQLYGEYRLVKYAIFLLENYFPKHDIMCIEQGLLMKELACGNKNALSDLERISGRTKLFAKKFFAFL